MRRKDVDEFHYITHCLNVASIAEHGILSHNRARRVGHKAVDDPVVNQRRAARTAEGRPLHDYVNLYVYARNPMLFRLLKEEADVCVLRVSIAVLDITGTLVTDRNAAVDDARYAEADEGLALLVFCP